LTKVFDSVTNDIYIVQTSDHRVTKCSSDGKQTVIAGITGVSGASADKLSFPQGVFVDEESKDIFVADTGNDRIQKWFRHTKKGSTVDHLFGPRSLIKDKNNIFYMVNRNNHIVCASSPDISFISDE